MHIVIRLTVNQMLIWWRKNIDESAEILNPFKSKKVFSAILLFFGLIASLLVAISVLFLETLKISGDIDVINSEAIISLSFFLIFIFIVKDLFRVIKRFSKQQEEIQFLGTFPISFREILLSRIFAYSSIQTIVIWVVMLLVVLSVQISLGLSWQLILCGIFYVGSFIVGTVLLRDFFAILLALLVSVIGKKISRVMSLISFLLVLVGTFILAALVLKPKLYVGNTWDFDQNICRY